jgi:exodeoxyribonuclease VII small subunit
MSPKKTSAPSFEEALDRLEAIVESLERGDVPLDKAVELYEEGIRLSAGCAEKLKAAELRLKKLARSADGALKVSDLDAEVDV